MKTTRLLTVIIVLQLLTLVGQWLEGPRMISTASAQVANPGADRQAMLDEARATNNKLDKMIDLLSSGNVQVKVVSADERKDGGKH